MIAGETPPENGDDDMGIDITVQDATGRGAGGEESAKGAAGAQPGKEHRELVIANQSRLHPGEGGKVKMLWLLR